MHNKQANMRAPRFLDCVQGALLAPMSGVTDAGFRRAAQRFGASLVVSEMVASDDLAQGKANAVLRMEGEGIDTHVVQLAGCEEHWMAEGAKAAEAGGADIIDINMGCPAKKVCNKLAGSALLSDPHKVSEILAAVVAAVDIPVTLKIRTGPEPEQRNGALIARLAEEAGVAALAVHGRTRADKFQGKAEYETIAQICQEVSIPVFANGDIQTPQQAREVLQFTGADGVMIGRAAQGNPWIFREIRYFLDTGQCLPQAPAEEVHAVMRQHLQDLHEHYGQEAGVRVARKHIGWYLEGRPGALNYRSSLMQAEQPGQQLNLLEDYFSRLAGSGQFAADRNDQPLHRQAA